MKYSSYLSGLLLSGLLSLAWCETAISAPDLFGGTADVAEEGESAPPTQSSEIALRLAELERERAEIAGVTDASGTPRDVNLAAVVEKLDQIQLVLESQKALAESLEIQRQKSQNGQVPADEPSIYLLNSLYEQAAVADSTLHEKRSSLEATRDRFEDLDARRRALRAKLDKSQDGGTPAAQAALRAAKLAARLEGERLNLAVLELQMAQQEVDRQGSLASRIATLRSELATGESGDEEAMAALLARELELQRAKNAAERDLAPIELRLSAAKQRFAIDPEASADQLAVVEALTAYREILGRQMSLATSDMGRVDDIRSILGNWNFLLKGAYSSEQLAAWEEFSRNQLADLNRLAAARKSQITDLNIRLEGLESRKAQLPPDSQASKVAREIGVALNRLNADLFTSSRLIDFDRRIVERFLADVEKLTGDGGLLEQLRRVAGFLVELWGYEITTIDDSPFTVGSLTMGILLFAIGVWASRLAAAALGRVAEQRLKLDPGAAQAMQTFSFYVLLAGFTLLALRAVHFPLTAFTFLGGALAIGIGFGSQNVMNNFISGLILMLERPVRAQDVVEIDGAHGVIQRIGPRSTQIRSTDGRHIVVPNSFFLESNVVNWTLSDDLMRTKVSVGVSYGSPTRLVKEVIEQVIRKEPLVLNTPPPVVIFEAFADNSLNFDVYFWVEARGPMKVREVESRLRFEIDDAFRDKGIVIAFPQRDVHLDSLSPLEVRLSGPAGGASTPPESSV